MVAGVLIRGRRGGGREGVLYSMSQGTGSGSGSGSVSSSCGWGSYHCQGFLHHTYSSSKYRTSDGHIDKNEIKKVASKIERRWIKTEY